MPDLRHLTRDLILENIKCNCFPPEDCDGYSLTAFTDMMFQVAQTNGYEGTINDFEKDFVDSLNGTSVSSNGIVVQRGSINDFPKIGVEQSIYVDTTESKIYYWKDNSYHIVFTILQPNVILDGGSA